jgi:hypothetical protein
MTDSRQREAFLTCPCGKRAYTSRAVARRAARILYPGARMRAYACRADAGRSGPWWHLTSQDARRVAWWRERDAVRAPEAEAS